jgi:hypothetical protein
MLPVNNIIFVGERANIVKRGDNLQPEGDFQKRPDQTWAPGTNLDY